MYSFGDKHCLSSKCNNLLNNAHLNETSKCRENDRCKPKDIFCIVVDFRISLHSSTMINCRALVCHSRTTWRKATASDYSFVLYSRLHTKVWNSTGPGSWVSSKMTKSFSHIRAYFTHRILRCCACKAGDNSGPNTEVRTLSPTAGQFCECTHMCSAVGDALLSEPDTSFVAGPRAEFGQLIDLLYGRITSLRYSRLQDKGRLSRF